MLRLERCVSVRYLRALAIVKLLPLSSVWCKNAGNPRMFSHAVALEACRTENALGSRSVQAALIKKACASTEAAARNWILRAERCPPQWWNLLCGSLSGSLQCPGVTTCVLLPRAARVLCEHVLRSCLSKLTPICVEEKDVAANPSLRLFFTATRNVSLCSQTHPSHSMVSYVVPALRTRLRSLRGGRDGSTEDQIRKGGRHLGGLHVPERQNATCKCVQREVEIPACRMFLMVSLTTTTHFSSFPN